MYLNLVKMRLNIFRKKRKSDLELLGEELEGPEIKESEQILSKDLQILAAKLDLINASLENLNQRLANLERIALQEQRRRW